jgi:hypothetical protein
MKTLPYWMRFGCVVALLSAGAQHGVAQIPGARWYRGNTHTHTLNSDGDSPPDAVIRWYRQHGYQFVVITDHEFITDVAPLNELFGAAGRFLVISGQEVTQKVTDAAHPDGRRQAHVNALGVTRAILPLGEATIATNTTVGATYARNIAAIRAAGGVAQINHPNYRWSVPLTEFINVPDSTLFEVWNGHPTVYNNGGVDSAGRTMPSTDVLWDSLLTRGKIVFGVADDDSHSFRPEDAENADLARPGRGWIMVRADTLTPQAILGAIRRGDFYSSTGVRLLDYRADRTEMRISIAADGDRRYTTEFMGSGGSVLATVYGTTARYRITGSEGYVRARVTDSSGRRAWLQPMMLGRQASPGR